MADFTGKLNEWVEEEVDVPVIEPEINNRGQVTGLKHSTRKAAQRVMYSRLSDPVSMSCSDMHHDWYIPDKHNHVAFCRNCKKRRIIRAVFEQVRDGKILDRDTQLQID